MNPSKSNCSKSLEESRNSISLLDADEESGAGNDDDSVISTAYDDDEISTGSPHGKNSVTSTNSSPADRTTGNVRQSKVTSQTIPSYLSTKHLPESVNNTKQDIPTNFDPGTDFCDDSDYSSHHCDDGSQDRVTVNLSSSNLQHYLFALAPDVFSYRSELYCMISLKVHPSFCQESIKVKVSNDGWRASITFPMPKSYMEPRNLLGADIAEDHVIYQAVKSEIFRLQKHIEKQPIALLQLNLPFPAEPKTTDDIFGARSGQTANLIPLISTKSKQQIYPDNFTGNVVFFFKKRGGSFHLSTRTSSLSHDGRDMTCTLEKTRANCQMSQVVQPHNSNNQLAASCDDTNMPHANLIGSKRKK